MNSADIKAFERQEISKKITRKIRKEGNVPCIIYGGEENIHFYVPYNELIHVVYTPDVYFVNLEINGKTHKSIIKDIQFHPVTDRIQHIDFLEVTDDKKITVQLPVKLHGDSEGVKQGGKLHLLKRRLTTYGLAKDLPGHLNIDISGITLGKTMKVRDLSYENLELLDPKDDVVCSVKLTRTSRGAEAEMEEGEEEGEAAEEGTTEGEATGEEASKE